MNAFIAKNLWWIVIPSLAVAALANISYQNYVELHTVSPAVEELQRSLKRTQICFDEIKKGRKPSEIMECQG